MVQKIRDCIEQALKTLGFQSVQLVMEHPADFSHGDYSINVALVLAKEARVNPRDLADKIVAELRKSALPEVQKIESAGAGFINFFLSSEYYGKVIANIVKNPADFGRNSLNEGKTILVEHTDPNAFKVFHIGHLMSNAIGEAISRLADFSGAKVERICYPSDIGLHIAKAVWAMMKHENEIPSGREGLAVKTDFLGKCYVEGTKAYEFSEEDKKEIDEVNRKVFEKSDKKVTDFYEKGRAWSLEHFEEIYKRLGTKFDWYVYESEAGKKGQKIVIDFLARGIFEKSDKAVVFKGEKYNLHTRVFINSEGFPTYEAKEIGLNVLKFKKFPKAAESWIVTASEQNDYFKVLVKVLGLIDEKIGERTKHIGHGMLRLPSGKMSSRTGEVITTKSLLSEVEKFVAEKIKDRGYDEKIKKEILDKVSVGAVKYSILKQAVGGDIIYDFEKSISFEGDSGPYLQYSFARAKSVLEKAKSEKIKPSTKKIPSEVKPIERLLSYFPEVVERAGKENLPHYVATYLIELAGAFNSFYAVEKIVDKSDEFSPYKVALTESVAIVLKNGLWILGIGVPEKM